MHASATRLGRFGGTLPDLGAWSCKPLSPISASSSLPIFIFASCAPRTHY